MANKIVDVVCGGILAFSAVAFVGGLGFILWSMLETVAKIHGA